LICVSPILDFSIGKPDIPYPATTNTPSGNTKLQIRSVELALSQQLSHNAEPFRIYWLSANGFGCPTIPVGCIALIAFLAMQVGVYPRTLGAFVLLSRFVGPRPIALGIPP
jgi:hypothetical protein